MDFLVKLLTGVGVAIPCGLNPYLPLLVISVAGLGGKYTLSSPYTALGSWPVIVVLAVLVGVDIFAGKFPQIERLYTNVNYLIRPVAGAIAFAATVPESQLNGGLSFVLGLALALVTYLVKNAWRNALTARSRNAQLLEPLFSTGENVLAGIVALMALLVGLAGGPLAILLLAGLTLWTFNLRRRRLNPPLATDLPLTKSR